jgi:GPH family glycoside/pentoside/hexuronide:cation symporter
LSQRSHASSPGRGQRALTLAAKPAAPLPAPSPEGTLPLGRIVAFGAASIGLTSMAFVNALYLFKFSTDVLLIAPGVMGLLYGVSRIWDAISDPLVGRMSDLTRSRLGRRRSWIFASIPATGLAFIMLWAPPSTLDTLGLSVWVGVALLIFSTAQTMFSVPHYALGVEMTSDYNERTRVFGVRQLMGGAGLLIGVVSFYGLASADDPRAFALPLAIAIAVGAGLLTGFGVAPIRERPEYQGRGGEGLRRAFWDVFRNPHARLLLLMYGIESFGAATTGILSVYITQYVVKAPQAFYIVILMFYIVPSFALGPLWSRISRRVGKRRLWLWSMVVATIAYALHSFLGEGTIVFWCAISVLQGTTAGVGSVIGPSIKGDVIDWDELQTGERKEGAYLAVWTFVQKSAHGLCAILLGFALQWVGFEPNAEQTIATKWTLLGLYGFLPAICYGIGTVLLARFQLNEREHAAIRAELDARAAAARDE